MHKPDTQTVSIQASPEVVLDLVADPLKLPQWAPGFATAVRRDGEHWIVDSNGDERRIVVRVSREHGTVDFLVADAPPGIEIGSYTRVLPNREGCVYLFTQFLPADASEAEARGRRDIIAGELATVKTLCEEAARSGG